MKPGVSLYLNLVRVSAALMVFFEHFREHTRNSFALFWRAHPLLYRYSGPLSLTAVIVFFVLSGYMIAHVLTTRENTPLQFCASRLARLYSVAIPALILAAATNYMEAWRYPHAFDAYANVPDVLRYLSAGLFVTNYWVWADLAPPNLPYWTLGHEAAYYTGIALFAFTRRHIRVLSLTVLTLLAGPTILLLAPTWLLGYWAYHFSHRMQLRPGASFAIWIASAALLLLCPLLQIYFRQPLPFLRMPDSHLGSLLASYAAAICFTANVLSFNGFSAKAETFFQPVAGLIGWLGSITFALYMFHQPLLSFFTVYPAGVNAAERSSPAQAALLIGGTLLFVATVGRLCEQSKGAYKRFFLQTLRGACAVRLPYVARMR
jgi:peptidoglycan/LPS O-acetylase OafA/YrhL